MMAKSREPVSYTMRSVSVDPPPAIQGQVGVEVDGVLKYFREGDCEPRNPALRPGKRGQTSMPQEFKRYTSSERGEEPDQRRKSAGRLPCGAPGPYTSE